MGTVIVAWLALGLAIVALVVALMAWLVERGIETKLKDTIAKVDAYLATLDGMQAERANADRVRDRVHQRTKVWPARPGSTREN